MSVPDMQHAIRVVTRGTRTEKDGVAFLGGSRVLISLLITYLEDLRYGACKYSHNWAYKYPSSSGFRDVHRFCCCAMVSFDGV